MEDPVGHIIRRYHMSFVNQLFSPVRDNGEGVDIWVRLLLNKSRTVGPDRTFGGISVLVGRIPEGVM